MRVVIAGGGTGGHFYPGLALAEELVGRDPATRVLFLCTDRDRVPDSTERLTFKVLPVTHRGSRLKRIASLGPALLAVRREVRAFKPHVVVGLGGYASLAPVLYAALRNIPTLLLEQNVLPGQANRLLLWVADELAAQWEETKHYVRCPGKVRHTGNPVRASIRRLDRPEAAARLGLSPERPTVLVMGGSQAATPINELMIQALDYLDGLDAQFVHLAGARDAERVRQAYAASGIAAAVFDFLDEMTLAYSVAGLAVCRAGGTSIAELTALGIPAVLIPYPHAADNHQLLNALVLEQHGAARAVEQKDLTGELLAGLLRDLLESPPRLERMAHEARRFGRPNAATTIAEAARRLAAGNGRERPPLLARILAAPGPRT